jgi:hypothetical protein
MVPVVLAVVCVACCGAPGYEGDGGVVLKGIRGEFELELGSIDASKPGRRAFRMRGLSSSEFSVGFRATERHSVAGDYFVYRAGKSTDVPNRPWHRSGKAS